MTLTDLLETLRSRDIRLRVEGADLRFSAPPGAVDAEVRAAVAEHRSTLLQVFGATGAPSAAEVPAPRGRQGGGPAEEAPLSFGQQRMWVLDKMLPPSAAGAYNLSGVAEIRGRLDHGRLESALNAVLVRHEALRTVVAERDGRPHARVLDDHRLTLVRVTVADAAERERILAAESARGFDLGRGPVLRALLIQEGPELAHLLLCVHHICADGWSLDVLYRDLFAAYAAGGAQLPELPLQYGDYARWQRARQESAEAVARESYWRDRLAGVPAVLDLPTDRPRPAVQSFRGEVHSFRIDRELGRQISALAARTGTTDFMVLLAAWSVVLSRAARVEDLVVGTPVAGRTSPELEPLIGFFANTLALRIRLPEDASFEALLTQVRQVTLEAVDHQDTPFERVVEICAPDRSLGHSPLFQHMLIVQTADREEFGLPGLRTQLREVHPGTAKFDMTLRLAQDADGMAGSLEYATDLFDAESVDGHVRQFLTVLSAATARPGTPVSRLPLLTPAEASHLAELGRGPVVDLPDETVVGLVEQQVRRTPDRIALVQGERELTYAQMWAEVVGVSEALRARGVGRGTVVALSLRRTPELVVCLLAVLRAGAAYLPLDPASPARRNDDIVADSGASLVLTQAGVPRPESGPGGIEVLRLEDLPNAGPGAPTGDGPAEGPGPDDDAYLIYTSGSTGRPKGVTVRHRNLVNFCRAMDLEFGDDAVGTWLAVTTVSFDIAALELLWTLTRGSCVAVQAETIRLGRTREVVAAPARGSVSLSLFYFAAATGGSDTADTYRLLMEGARFADDNGFEAVWTPERHFHEFGGLYPNPSLVAAALAAVTTRIGIRAGSVVLPLHHPLRVAEEWSVVDNLSGGRVGVSFASGWQPDDFVLAPDAYADRREVMRARMETVRSLWRGEPVELVNGLGKERPVRISPRPVQPELPVWVTAAGSPQTFRGAGEAGANLLTHLLGQDVEQLAERIGIYREARAAAGHEGPGQVTLMLHTFVGPDDAATRRAVREPFRSYLASSLDLIGSLAASAGITDVSALGEEDMAALLDRAFDRYYETATLFGTVAGCADMLDRVAAAGVDEVACLVDFGIPTDEVLASLPRLLDVREMHRARAAADEHSVAELIGAHGVTHLQCTPSQAAQILLEPGGTEALRALRCLLVGGEALPAALAGRLTELPARVNNMYGPTETTIWSTTHRLEPSAPPSIGRPVANTTVHVLDAHGQPVPVGVPGELHIAGAGVAAGYHRMPELTAERFLPDPFAAGATDRMYRTGDTVVMRADGRLDFIGRGDGQVKLRGHRIELGEIESLLAEHPDVAQAAATVDGEGLQQVLACFVVLVDGHGAPSPDRLRAHLASRLPEYMLPGHFQLVDQLPYTANGKLDRGALPAVELGDRDARAVVAPRNEHEERVRQVWEEVLGRPTPSVVEDFFRVGGNSVLAVMLLARVGDVFGRRLPLARFYQDPTVAGLAAQLRRSGDDSRTTLVLLRDGGPEQVFLLPGAGGNLLYFRELAEALPESFTVYGLQPSYGEDVPEESIVERHVEEYLDAVLGAAAGRRSISLVGHSFGGYVALELARRLGEDGVEVDLVGLIDTTAPLPDRKHVWDGLDREGWVLGLVGVTERTFGRSLGLRREDLVGLSEEDQLELVRLRMASAGVLPPELGPAEFSRFVQVFMADQRSAYVPAAPYPGRLVLFRAEVLHPDSRPTPGNEWVLDDPSRGWSRFATEPVEVRVVSGDHLTMLQPPYVLELAEQVQAARAGRAVPASAPAMAGS